MTPARAGGLLVVGFAVVVVAFVVLVGVKLAGGGSDTDCDGFRVAPGDWQAASFDRRQDLVTGMNDCGTLDGASAADVQALLGPPSSATPQVLRYDMPIEDSGRTPVLQVELRDGEVQRLFVPDDLAGGRTP